MFSSADNGAHVFSFTFNTLGPQTPTLTGPSISSPFGSTVVNVLTK